MRKKETLRIKDKLAYDGIWILLSINAQKVHRK